MSQEVWNIIMWAAGTGGVTVALTRLWTLWTRSRAEKKTDNANARLAGVQADKAELELWEDERKALLESKNWWLSEFNRVDKLLITFKKESDANIEALSGEIKKLRAAYDDAISERDTAVAERDSAVAEAKRYRGLLGKLVEAVIRNCGKIDVTEYQQAIE